MKHIASILGMMAAALAALLVLPAGTAGASPASAMNTGNGSLSIAPSGTHITAKVADGVFVPNKARNELRVVNARGQVTETIGLAPVVNGQKVNLVAALSSDRKTATFSPVGKVHRHQVSKKKDKAFDSLVSKANKHWPCAAPAVIVGGILGALLLFWLPIVGWVGGAAIGAAIGANYGYGGCGKGKARGETVRAFWKWWNTP